MASSRNHSVGKGAMTMEMEAARVDAGPKVLRIGVVESARIVDERVMLHDGPVSIGRTEKSTFGVANDDVPLHHVLFENTSDSHRLCFTDAMIGRVVIGGAVFTLAQLRESGRARRVASGWEVALDTSARGRIAFGSVALLFQFVAKPPVAPRAQLPIAIRNRPVREMDRTYASCLALFVSVAFGAVSYVEYGYDPEVDDGFELHNDPIRTLALATPPAPLPSPASHPTPEPSPTTPGNAPAPRPAVATNGHTPTPPSHAHPPDSTSHVVDAANAALIASNATLHDVESGSRFNALVGYGAAPREGIDHLLDGTTMQATIAALGTHVTSEGTDPFHRNLVASNGPIGPDAIGRSRRIDGPTGPLTGDPSPVEHAPVGRIVTQPLEATDGAGTISQAEVANVVRQNLSGIRWCYNEALVHDPTLTARVEVHFTLGGAGRIVDAPEISGLDAAASARTCIANRFRSMRFPSATGGSVSFAFPFQFTPGT